MALAHVAFKLNNGTVRVPCVAARRNVVTSNTWMQPKEFDAQPEQNKCKHCIKILADDRARRAAKKAADEAKEARTA